MIPSIWTVPIQPYNFIIVKTIWAEWTMAVTAKCDISDQIYATGSLEAFPSLLKFCYIF